MFLEQIVTSINDAIVLKLQSNDINISLHSISKQVPRTRQGDEDQIPLYVDYMGEGSFNAIDDRFALCIYHTCNSLEFESKAELEFGDGQDFQTDTANMSVFIYGDRRKLKMIQETIIAIVASAMPASYTASAAGFSSANISSVSSPNDSLVAWRDQFQNIPYPLSPEKFFVQLNYQIQTIIQKSCIEVCAEC